MMDASVRISESGAEIAAVSYLPTPYKDVTLRAPSLRFPAAVKPLAVFPDYRQ